MTVRVSPVSLMNSTGLVLRKGGNKLFPSSNVLSHNSCNKAVNFNSLNLYPSAQLLNQFSKVTFSTTSSKSNHRKQSKSSSSFGRFLWPSIAGIGFYWLGKPTEKYPKIEGQSFLLQYFTRSREKLADFFYGFQEPAFDKFLPDKPVNEQHPRKFTLVIDLDDFLVTHIWDTRQGKWKIAKRPGAEIFLFYMAQYYEVVLFSSMNQQVSIFIQ